MEMSVADLEVVAILKAKDGQADRLQAALQAFVGPTREEPGCLSYELFESGAAAGTFITVERWRSQQDVDSHLKAPHMSQFYDAAGDTLDGPVDIHPLNPLKN
jgi:quinol monooxygenase YgiN